MTEKVSVSKSLLYGLAAVAAAALLVVAFLLGRETGQGRPVAPSPGPASKVTAAVPREQTPPVPSNGGTVRDAAGASGVPEPLATPAPLSPEPPRAHGAETPAPASRPTPRGDELEATRSSVAAYLDAVDRIQPGKMGGDAESVANEMAGALVKGDTSGLDKMIRETEAAKASLAALTPPAPCVTHHRESLGSVDDALEMLNSLKKAMESPEPVAGLASVSARANALRARAEAIEKEEAALRLRYGLTR